MMDMKMRQQAVKDVRKKLMSKDTDFEPKGKPMLSVTIMGKKPLAHEPDDEDYCPECDAPMEKGLCPDCEREERELEASTDEAAEDVPPTALKKLISQIVDQKLKG